MSHRTPTGAAASSGPGPGPAYDFHRSKGTSGPVDLNISGNNAMKAAAPSSSAGESLDYSNAGDGDSESYLAIHTLAESSIVTGHMANYHNTHADATDTVHEMHLALLYLLSNPEEFKKALASHPARGATTLAEWNAEYDNESLTDAGSTINADDHTVNTAMQAAATPLPFVVFADDAEVVLPQAHTASQLFGVERLEGIELEAAAGIPALSQLFLRWLGTQCLLACLEEMMRYCNMCVRVSACASFSCLLSLTLFTHYSTHAGWRPLEYY